MPTVRNLVALLVSSATICATVTVHAVEVTSTVLFPHRVAYISHRTRLPFPPELAVTLKRRSSVSNG